MQVVDKLASEKGNAMENVVRGIVAESRLSKMKAAEILGRRRRILTGAKRGRKKGYRTFSDTKLVGILDKIAVPSSTWSIRNDSTFKTPPGSISGNF